MYTEEEAKKKHCPIYSISQLIGLHLAGLYQMSGIDVKENHIEGLRQSDHCIASECSMWRWSNSAILEDTTSKSDDRLRRTHTVDDALSNPPITSEMPVPKGEGWEPVGVPEPDEDGEPLFLQSWKRDADPERIGYCGLAGNPHA